MRWRHSQAQAWWSQDSGSIFRPLRPRLEERLCASRFALWRSDEVGVSRLRTVSAKDDARRRDRRHAPNGRSLRPSVRRLRGERSPAICICLKRRRDRSTHMSEIPLAAWRRFDHHGGGGMRNLARILCAIDLEQASEPAFDRALRLATIGDAKLFLLHATPANVRFSSRAPERLEYLTHLRKRADAAGVKVR